MNQQERNDFCYRLAIDELVKKLKGKDLERVWEFVHNLYAFKRAKSLISAKEAAHQIFRLVRFQISAIKSLEFRL